MSLYSFMDQEPLHKLFADRESGLNILWKEVLWDEGYGRFFK